MSVKTKKQIVIEEAAKLFRDKGYMAASMRELASRVGLEQASSLYNHIKSKEEALQRICFENANKFTAGISEIEVRSLSPVNKIEALIGLHIKVATQDVTAVTVFNDEWRHLSEPQLSEFLDLRKDYETRFKQIIQEGIDRGDFKKVNPDIAMQTILSSLKWIYYWYKPSRKSQLQDLEKDMINLITGGLIQQ